jgi:hypothetical protein
MQSASLKRTARIGNDQIKPGSNMGIEDRDWYRDQHRKPAQQTAPRQHRPNLLESIATETDRRRKFKGPLMALAWIAFAAALYAAFTFAGKH